MSSGHICQMYRSHYLKSGYLPTVSVSLFAIKIFSKCFRTIVCHQDISQLFQVTICHQGMFQGHVCHPCQQDIAKYSRVTVCHQDLCQIYRAIILQNVPVPIHHQDFCTMFFGKYINHWDICQCLRIAICHQTIMPNVHRSLIAIMPFTKCSMVIVCHDAICQMFKADYMLSGYLPFVSGSLFCHQNICKIFPNHSSIKTFVKCYRAIIAIKTLISNVPGSLFTIRTLNK